MCCYFIKKCLTISFEIILITDKEKEISVQSLKQQIKQIKKQKQAKCQLKQH